jgi:DNA-directed RNA polymerase specialized sigma24 family protein
MTNGIPELLARFGRDRGEAAFVELVRRHRSDVLAICRRVIADPSGVEDAFQANFLVLARRANDLRYPEQLGRWLRGVADRVAQRARLRTVKRATAEQSLASVPEPWVWSVTPTVDLRVCWTKSWGVCHQSTVRRCRTAGW